jgi:hypothetical protein
MREHKIINAPKVIESKVVCNKCGLEYDDEKSEHGYEEWQWDTIHAFKVEFGYGSKHDLEKWNFDLCENCIEELVSTFKIDKTCFYEEQ